MPCLDLTFYEAGSLALQAVGIVIVAAYTILTRRQVEALIVSNATNKEALAETQRSNDIARENLILGRRAWVNCRIIGSPFHETFMVEVVNVGMVPTPSLSIRYSFGVVPNLAALQDQAPGEIPIAPFLIVGALGVQDTFSFAPAIESVMSKYRTAYGPDLKGDVLQLLLAIRYDNGFGTGCIAEYGWELRSGAKWTRLEFQKLT